MLGGERVGRLTQNVGGTVGRPPLNSGPPHNMRVVGVWAAKREVSILSGLCSALDCVAWSDSPSERTAG